MLSSEFIERMKKRLLEEKAKLEEDLKGLPAHTEIGNDDDDGAMEFPVDGVNQDLIYRIRTDLEKIEKALSKIEAGTYGVDDDGKEISEERLEVLPWADKAI